jgi:fatty-acyl-CoA synthase
MGVRIIEQTEAAYGYPLLIKNILTAPLRFSPDTEIVYSDRSRYTYRELSRRVSKLAHALGDLGVSAGDTVAILDWDSHRYLECYFAVPMIGAVLHTVNIRLSPEQIAYTINHAEDDVLVIHEDFMQLYQDMADQLQIKPKVILISEAGKEEEYPGVTVGEYESILSDKCSHYVFPDFDENAVATLFYTTGTTGLPKGVCFSHRQIVLHTYGFMSGLCGYDNFGKVDSSDVYLPLTPMFHVHAWGMPYLFTMLGAKQVYPGRFEPAKVLGLIAREKATFSHCVPTILHMLLSATTGSGEGLQGWKVVIGGSALPQGLCREARKMGINLFSAYGMSETCPLITIAIPKKHMQSWSEEELEAIRCRTGIAVPFVDLEIVDADGKPLPHDGEHKGEVVARSPWLTQAYFKEKQRSIELWKDGWLHTGDVGFIDSDGYLQITDRIKDVIKTGGEWISSLELEDLISRIDGVSEVAVVGAPHQKWGERPLALVVVKSGCEGQVSGTTVLEFCREQAGKGVIPRYGIPEKVVVVERLAKTSVGKLNKKALREEYRKVFSDSD